MAEGPPQAEFFSFLPAENMISFEETVFLNSKNYTETYF